MGQMWQAGFETDYFYEDMMDLWDQVFPLYEQLHTFVRRRLRSHYGDRMGEDDGLIPAHLLGTPRRRVCHTAARRAICHPHYRRSNGQ